MVWCVEQAARESEDRRSQWKGGEYAWKGVAWGEGSHRKNALVTKGGAISCTQSTLLLWVEGSLYVGGIYTDGRALLTWLTRTPSAHPS